jgi:hypothetical protein
MGNLLRTVFRQPDADPSSIPVGRHSDKKSALFQVRDLSKRRAERDMGYHAEGIKI